MVEQQDIRKYNELHSYVRKNGIAGKRVPLLDTNVDRPEFFLYDTSVKSAVGHLHNVLVKGAEPFIHDLIWSAALIRTIGRKSPRLQTFKEDCDFAIHSDFPFIEWSSLNIVKNVVSGNVDDNEFTNAEVCYVLYNLMYARVRQLDTPSITSPSLNPIEALKEAVSTLEREQCILDARRGEIEDLMNWFKVFCDDKTKAKVLDSTGVQITFEDSLVNRSMLYTHKNELGSMIKYISEFLVGGDPYANTETLKRLHYAVRYMLYLRRLMNGDEGATEDVVLSNILDGKYKTLGVNAKDVCLLMLHPMVCDIRAETLMYISMFVLEDLFALASKLDGKSIVLSTFEKHVNELPKEQEYNEDGTKVEIPYELIPRYVLMGYKNNTCLSLLGKLLELPTEYTEDLDASAFCGTMQSIRDYLVNNSPCSGMSVQTMSNQTIRDTDYVQVSLLRIISGHTLDKDKLSSVMRRLVVGTGIDLLQRASPLE